MQDTCIVQVYSVGSTDDYGNPVAAYADGSAVACGLRLLRPDEVQASGEVATIEAELRLPLATAVKPLDRIKLTHRYGEVLSAAEVFEVVGPVKRGPSGLVVRLARSNV